MKEFEFLKKLNKSFKEVRVSYFKIGIAFLLMSVTAIFEMAGLSILYPLILFIGKNADNVHSNSLHFLPNAISDKIYNAELYILFLTFAFIFITKNIILYLTYKYNIGFSMYYYKNLVQNVFKVFLNRSVLGLQSDGSGYMTNIICVQTKEFIHGVIRPMFVLLTELIIFSAIACFVFFMSPLLICTLFGGCAIAVGVYYFYNRKSALLWGQKELEADTMLHQLIHSATIGISEIKIFGQKNSLLKRLDDILEHKIGMFKNLELYQQTPRYIIETTFILMIILFCGLSLLFNKNMMELFAQISVVTAAAFRMLPSINRAVGSYSTISFHLCPSITLLDTLSEIRDVEHEDYFSNTPTDQSISKKWESIKRLNMVDLSFKYPNIETPVLDNINLQIQGNKKVGIVGLSGSGKSTFIKILTGLYSPMSGKVTCNDIEIHQNIRLWHSMLAYVPQDAFMLPGTIRENIVFGYKIDDENKIWDAINQVGLTDFIHSLTDHLNTIVGLQGIELSGGQKQLLCLARALYRNPQLLLLDEPTASLDMQNESIVLEVINRLQNNVMVIMISHKLNSFEKFDDLYLCQKGKLMSISLTSSQKLNTLIAEEY